MATYKTVLDHHKESWCKANAGLLSEEPELSVTKPVMVSNNKVDNGSKQVISCYICADPPAIE